MAARSSRVSRSSSATTMVEPRTDLAPVEVGDSVSDNCFKGYPKLESPGVEFALRLEIRPDSASGPRGARAGNRCRNTVLASPARAMHVAVVTLFPELFEPFLRTSFVGKALESAALQVHLEDLRQHGLGKHRSVDDTPYGGGSGMVMRPDASVAAIEAAEAALGAV